MKYDTIIFDFDGTIADTLSTGIDIYNSIAPKYHCLPIDPQDVPILQSMGPQELMKKYHVSKFKVPFLLWSIRRGLTKQITNIRLFPDMLETMQKLKSQGYNLGIMTSNSKQNVEMFLEHNDMTGLFDFIYSGKNAFGKAQVIKKLLKEQNISKDVVVYVGDETRDIEATKQVGIPIISVTWGFNSRKILETLQPRMIVDTPNDLLREIRKNA